jgi:hypothetical protein
MPKYVIEREMSGAGKLNSNQLRHCANFNGRTWQTGNTSTMG